ncbi:MAG: hypothetical protein ABI910_18535 [Gemmatimonadota bacterium]
MTIRKQAKTTASKGRPGTGRPGKGRPGKGQDKPRRKPRGGYGQMPPKEPQRISLAAAVELTQRYRKAAPASEHGGFFWADGIQELLAQPGCAGMRYYHGVNAEGCYQIVLVGVDANGNDITKAPGTRKTARGAVAAAGAGDAVLLDHHWPCPPYCPTDSPLL